MDFGYGLSRSCSKSKLSLCATRSLAGQSKKLQESRATSEVRRCMNQGLLGYFRPSALNDLLLDYLPDSKFEEQCCSLFPFLKAASTQLLYKRGKHARTLRRQRLPTCVPPVWGTCHLLLARRPEENLWYRSRDPVIEILARINHAANLCDWAFARARRPSSSRYSIT